MGTPGAPPYERDEETAATVKKLAAVGATMASIARRVMLTKQLVREHYRADFLAGIDEANEQVAGKLFQDCMSDGPKSTSARMFWLKCRAQWRENQRIELTGKDGGPVRTLDMSKLSDDELERILPVLEKLAAGSDDPGDGEGGEGGEDEAE